MNKYIKPSLLLALFLNSAAYALHPPVQGLYGGFMAEISHGPTSSNLVFLSNRLTFIEPVVPISGTITYDQVGGGGGGMLGYKFQHFRVEGEILYNRISTGPVSSLNSVTGTANLLTDTNICPIDNVRVFPQTGCLLIDNTANAGFKGSNAATFGFVNAFYDFFTLDTDYNIVPYVGAGIGKARIKSLNNFVTVIPFLQNGVLVAPQFYFDASGSASAMQGIIGVSYYMDDYAWLSLDYRYITTSKFTYRNTTPNTSTLNLNNFSQNLFNNKYTLNTLNITVNFAFDVGGIYC